MRFKKTKIKDLYIAKLESKNDSRGFFTRSYCKKELEKTGIIKSIKQANHSMTSKVGSIRGMHYQNPPYAENKIIRCIAGEIFDVVIDLRKNSETFLQWHGEYLKSNDFKMMIVPEGFAHGFQVIKENSEIIYLSTESYNPKAESGILFNDKSINIKWPLKVTDISKRDMKFNAISKNFRGINV
jgi:dTDP-4-dehydrorhamnose 3,5-epimerase